jgi:hypothetical protein
MSGSVRFGPKGAVYRCDICDKDFKLSHRCRVTGWRTTVSRKDGSTWAEVYDYDKDRRFNSLIKSVRAKVEAALTSDELKLHRRFP